MLLAIWWVDFYGFRDALAELSILMQMEYSLGMFYTILKDIMGNTKAKGKPGKNSLKENKIFKELVYHTEQMLNRGAVHPKFDKVLELVSCCCAKGPHLKLIEPCKLGNHIEAKRKAAARGGNGVTRCMVFCSFREGVNELVVRSTPSFNPAGHSTLKLSTITGNAQQTPTHQRA
jgi:hypothetical protein